MRRIAYYHIEFPKADRLYEIVQANVAPEEGLEKSMVMAAIEHFTQIRDHYQLRKKPATAELLSWIHVLNRDQVDIQAGLKADGDRELKQKIFKSYSLIAKNQEDLRLLRDTLGL